MQRGWARRGYAAVNNTDLVQPITYNHATNTGTSLIWNSIVKVDPD
jgi:hypothetical protein